MSKDNNNIAITNLLFIAAVFMACDHKASPQSTEDHANAQETFLKEAIVEAVPDHGQEK